jgi:hypothetical protein
MKHVTMAEKSLLMSDEAADLLTEYAAILARLNSGDTVMMRGIGIDGDEIVATYVLNSGTALMAESTHSNLPDPDNSDAIAYMRDRIQRYESFDDLIPDDDNPLSSGKA